MCQAFDSSLGWRFWRSIRYLLWSARPERTSPETRWVSSLGGLVVLRSTGDGTFAAAEFPIGSVFSGFFAPSDLETTPNRRQLWATLAIRLQVCWI